jgi:selenide,water dikinase
MMRGGLETLITNNVALLGGHSVDSQQIMFGYSVTGLIDPGKIATNAGARPGDVIILTKPIGTGVISAGIKFAKANEEVAAGCLATMLAPGKHAAAAMREFEVKGATDVTGFSLLGLPGDGPRQQRHNIDRSRFRTVARGALEPAAAGCNNRSRQNKSEYVGDDIFDC